MSSRHLIPTRSSLPTLPWTLHPAPCNKQVLIKTSTALYELVRPATKYRKSHANLAEMLELARGVYTALSPEAGGSMSASMDEVVAKLARQKVCGKVWGQSVEPCVGIMRGAQGVESAFVCWHAPGP